MQPNLDHPRPQFIRKEWLNLNGQWAFAFDDDRTGLAKNYHQSLPKQHTITVPFTYETKAGGIGEENFHPQVWYEREIDLAIPEGKEAVLYFEGSDWHTLVWVNGVFVGEHKGGYTRFGIDITAAAVQGKNRLTVCVMDSDDTQQPRGKQRWLKNNFGCWYVQTTGIWKTVWIEYRSPAHIESVKMTPDMNAYSLNVAWKVNPKQILPGMRLTAAVTYDGQPINTVTVDVMAPRGNMAIDVFSEAKTPWGLRIWTPENPQLYDIVFTLTRAEEELDRAASYFGMRDIRVEQGQVLLNGRPYYQKMLLDQGYWEDSHLTPPDMAALIEDIQKTKEMGFNGIRKHQKVEDERFYYLCDTLGVLVWSEMPSPYSFGDDMIENFMAEWQDIVKMHYNHPSVVTWTPINESWGVPRIYNDTKQQRFTEAVYCLTKAIDPMRPVIVNDGWEHTVSDILTLHDYEEAAEVLFDRYTHRKDEILDSGVWHNKHKTAFAKGYGYQGQPVIISEYGGAAYSSKAEGQWGYGNSVKTEADLIARIDAMTTAIRKLPYVCGYCYTQTTDVQQEVNGLMDISRRYKADVNQIRQINEKPVHPDYGSCK